MTANRTQDVFDRTASTYDADRAKLIPGYDRFYRWAVSLIPAGAKTILDLGAGSGLLTVRVRQRFPEARIFLMDLSAPMLELARKRLGDDSLLLYEQADYLTEDWPRDLCAVVSSLSIHHLDNEGKRTVFAKAYAALKPGGVFINAEQVAGPTQELEARYKSFWLEQVRAAGATERQMEDSLYRQQEDRCASVEGQLTWMRAAGFADADCWYKEGRFAVMAGTRVEAGRYGQPLNSRCGQRRGFEFDLEPAVLVPVEVVVGVDGGAAGRLRAGNRHSAHFVYLFFSAYAGTNRSSPPYPLTEHI